MEIIIPYEPRSYQKEIHDLMDKHRFFVLVAHRRLGKTVLSINQLIKRAIKDNKDQGRYGYIAPFRNQGKNIAWDYLKKYLKNVNFKKIYENDLKIRFHNGTEIRIFGADNPDNIRGQYFDGVIIDEVAQIKRELWEEVVRPAISDRSGWAIFICIPHGINMFHELYSHAKSVASPDWGAALYDVNRTMASADPPLSRGEVDNCRAEMTDTGFAREYLCDFNASSDDTLISLGLAVEASRRVLTETALLNMPVVFGVDVARFGDDDSAVCVRKGPAVLKIWSENGLATDALISRIIALEREFSPEMICVDSGFGQGVVDFGRKVLEAKVLEIPFGSKAVNDSKFVNRRSEMWFLMREFLRAGGAIPPDNRLIAELAAPCYSFDAAGRIQLERKERVRDRLAVSPDRADAMALTFAVNPAPHGLRDKLPRRTVGKRSFWGPDADWM